MLVRKLRRSNIVGGIRRLTWMLTVPVPPAAVLQQRHVSPPLGPARSSILECSQREDHATARCAEDPTSDGPPRSAASSVGGGGLRPQSQIIRSLRAANFGELGWGVFVGRLVLWTRLEDEELPRSVGQDSKPGADVAVLVVGDQQTEVAS